MPTIKQSQKVDRSRLAPVEQPITAAPAPLPPIPSPFAPSPFMACSLPPIAASYDHYVRQFYNSQNPQMRILTPSTK